MNAVVLNCNERNYTVRTSRIAKCETVFFGGELSRHPDEKQEFQRKKGKYTGSIGNSSRENRARFERTLSGTAFSRGKYFL